MDQFSFDEALPTQGTDDIAVIERVGSTAVVTITVQELAGEELAATLRVLLSMTRDQGARSMILDLQNVSAMDSANIAVLVEMLTQMQQSQERGRIALVNADRSVQYLFGITRLDRVFPICRDVMTALSAVEHRGSDAEH